MKILIADDSPVIRTAVTVILDDAGYEVVTAEDGIETIQKFYSERPDLLVLDIQMPNMTGPSVQFSRGHMRQRSSASC